MLEARQAAPLTTSSNGPLKASSHTTTTVPDGYPGRFRAFGQTAATGNAALLQESDFVPADSSADGCAVLVPRKLDC